MLVSMGTDQNGDAMRGKKIHIESASGSAYNTRRSPVRELIHTDSVSAAAILSQRDREGFS